MKRRLNILLIELEFSTWGRARSWSYCSQLGIEEGLHANGVNFVTIPELHEIQANNPASRLYHIGEICSGEHFDQVWIELVHSNIDENFLQRLTTLAPIRVAFVPESLQYSPETYSISPHLKDRRSLVENRLKYMTHAVVADEKDAEDLNTRKVIKAMWWIQAIPERFICDQPTPAKNNYATFCGALYGERLNWIKLPSLRNLLVRTESLEDATPYPKLFDEINQTVTNFLRSGKAVKETHLKAYLEPLRQIRRECFALWLEGLRSGCAIVNLPTLVSAYAGRVVEGMAAGRPVISWEVPNRPRNKAIFEDGKEILLFPKDDPKMLADHIRHIQHDHAFGQGIAMNARRKLLRFHTIEKRVQQILNWTETGIEPAYEEAEDRANLDQLLRNFRLNFVLDDTTVQNNFPNVNPTPDLGVIYQLNQAREAILRQDIPLASNILNDIVKNYPGMTEVRNLLDTLKNAQVNSGQSQKENYYSKLFIEDPSWSSPYPNDDEKARWDKISQFLEMIKHTKQSLNNNKLRILDLGCGRGWLTNLASAFGQSEGVDPVMNVIGIAHRHFPNINFQSGTAQTIMDMPDFSPYDIVLTSEVIEHVPRNQQQLFVNDIRGLLKDKGYVILTTPRAEVFDQWMKLTNFSKQPVDDWLTEPEVLTMFTDTGFKCLGRDRIYVDTLNRSGNSYVLAPTIEQLISSNLIALYQIWVFQKDTSHISDTPETSGSVLKEPAPASTGLAMKTGYDAAIVNRGNMLVKIGRFDEAIKEFEKIVKLHPDYSDGYVVLACARHRKGDLYKAEQDLKEAIKLDVNNFTALKNLARLYFDMRCYTHAITVCRAVLLKDSNDVDTLVFLGDCCRKMNLREPAIAEYQKVLKLSPKHRDAKRGLTMVKNTRSGTKSKSCTVKQKIIVKKLQK